MTTVPTTVLALVGSLRAGSTNRQLAETAAENAPNGVLVEVFDRLDELPFYNEDIDVEGRVPAAVAELREDADRADTLLLFAPEYNGTLPAVLKNAIDWLSRPYGHAAIKGKPAAVIGTAFGQYGGVWAHGEARRALGIAGAQVLEDVTLAIPNSLVRFADLHPRADAEVVGKLGSVLDELLAAVGTGSAAA